MNEKVLEKLLSWAQSAEIFVAEQAPQVVQELLTYHLYVNIIGCVVSLLFAVLIILLILKLYEKTYDEFLTFLIGATLIIPLGTTTVSISEIMKIKLAPKVFVIDYIRGKK